MTRLDSERWRRIGWALVPIGIMGWAAYGIGFALGGDVLSARKAVADAYKKVGEAMAKSSDGSDAEYRSLLKTYVEPAQKRYEAAIQAKQNEDITQVNAELKKDAKRKLPLRGLPAPKAGPTRRFESAPVPSEPQPDATPNNGETLDANGVPAEVEFAKPAPSRKAH